MRLLAGADFHGDHEICSWFVAKARELTVDAIVLAGDILGFPGAVDDPEADQAIDAGRLEADLLAAERPVLFIMGNDDLIDFEPSSERFLPLHGRRIEMGDFNFAGYQYSLPWMGGIFEKPDDEIAADLEEMKGKVDDRTVFVTHSPAFGILDPGFGPKKIGSRSLSLFLDAHPVRAHIHGHSHGGFGRTGVHFNVASARHKRAMMIDLSSLRHKVVGE